MPGWLRRFGPPDPRRYKSPGRSTFALRLAIYAAIVLALLVFRVVPSLRSRLPQVPEFGKVDSTLAVAGTSIAPDLIRRLVEEFKTEYPAVKLDARAGGTAQGLEALLNGRTDVAFLSRLPNVEESRLIRARHDSVSTFPVALAGIAVIAGDASPYQVLAVEDLRRILSGGPAAPGDPERLYVPEPNRGLWGAVVAQLGIPENAPAALRWLAAETDVVDAVSKDPAAIGLASTLALPDSLEERGVRMVGLRPPGSDRAFTANSQDVAAGGYPLFHYLYVSCHARCGALASGFVTYLSSGRGQHFVSRSGYVPARDVPLRIHMETVKGPIGAPSK
ncbi:MAG: substrate-binding domain-containing protein [bacterium]